MAVTKDFTASASLSGNTITYILRVTENSTNTAANTSNITVKAILKQSWNGYLFGDWHTGVSCTINGSQKFSDYTQRSLNGTGEHVYYTWTGDVAHNSDGSLSLKVGGKVWQDTPTYFVSNGITISESSSNTLTLTEIPRASSVSVSSSSRKPGESQTITITKASTSFTDTVTWSCGNSSGTIATKSTGTSHSWTVPLSLIKQSPNANQTCTITTTTYNGNTSVGSKSTTFTVGYYGASTISATSGNTIGSAVSATISRANSNFTHSMWWSFGSKTWQSIGSNLGTSASFTPATSTFAPLIPSATSGTLTLILRTYYDGVQVGSDTTKTLTLNLPSSVKPTMGNPTITINNPTVASSWGVAIQGISTVTVAITGASAGTGSTISSYSISGGGFSGTSSSLTTGVLTNASQYTFTCTVTDARGRTSDAKTISVTPVAYSSPTITIKNAYRATQASDGTITKNNDSTSICAEVEYAYSSVSSKNSISRSVGCNSVSNTNFSSGDKVFLEANCSTTSEYTITASISDALGRGDSSSFTIYTASRVVNINKDKDGIAFGGYSTEANKVQSYWPIKAIGGIVDEKDNNVSKYIKNITASGQTVTFTRGDGTTGTFTTQDNNTTYTFNGAVSTIKDSNLTANRALVSNGSGKVAVSAVTSTELGYLDGVTSAIQTQLNGKAASSHTHSGYASSSHTHSTYLPYAGGTMTGNITTKASDNSSGGLCLGSKWRDGYSDWIDTYWKDGKKHQFLQRQGDGLTSAFGWSGSSSYATVTYIRGRTCQFSNASGTSTLSDINLKEDIVEFDEKYDAFFDNLKPTTYKYILGSSGRPHSGFIAQEVESALEEAGLTTKDFGGVNIRPIEYYEQDVEDSSVNYLLDKGIKEEHNLIYTEFVALNTWQIQKLKAENKELKEKLSALENKFLDLEEKLNNLTNN